MFYVHNERRHGTNLKKDLFLSHLQPPLDKNSEDFFSLKYDDVSVSRVGSRRKSS